MQRGKKTSANPPPPNNGSNGEDNYVPFNALPVRKNANEPSKVTQLPATKSSSTPVDKQTNPLLKTNERPFNVRYTTDSFPAQKDEAKSPLISSVRAKPAEPPIKRPSFVQSLSRKSSDKMKEKDASSSSVQALNLSPTSPEPKKATSKKLEKFFGNDFKKQDSTLLSPEAQDQQEMHRVFENSELMVSSSPCVFNSTNGKIFTTELNIFFCSSDSNIKVIIPFRNISNIASKKKGSLDITTFSTMTYCFSNVKKEAYASVDSTYKKSYIIKNFNLFLAIERNDAERVKALLKPDRVSSVMETDEFQSTPLHAAVRSGNPEIVQAFLLFFKMQNLDVNVKDMYGWTPMHVGANSNAGSGHEDDILRMLLEHPGMMVEAKNNDGNTPLHYFSLTWSSPNVQEIGELLIKKHKERGSTVNVFNNLGETPLHRAIINPAVRLMIVQLLISHGADVNIPTNTGDSVLHYAVRVNRKDLVKLLINSGANLLLKNKEKKTAFELCVSTTDKKVTEMLTRANDVQLEEHFTKFLKEELFVDVLTEVDDKILDASLARADVNISAGAQIRLKKAIQKYKINPQKPVEVKKANPQGRAALTQSVGGGMDIVQAAHEIRQEQLEFTKILGSGTFGTVFKGLYKEERVAIKVLNESTQARSEFKKEYDIMSTVRSPYLVRFIGASMKPKICLVMEYCSRGSLYHVLNEIKTEFSWEMGLKWAFEMMAGLYALHSWDPPIVHRDMKSLNLLVAEDWSIRLTDFGLSRFDTALNQDTMMKIVGTAIWCPPEMYHGYPYIDKSDVYSAAIILWEIITRLCKGRYEQPFREYSQICNNNIQVMVQVAMHNLRPSIHQACPPKIADLITRMWNPEAAKRPVSSQVMKELLTMRTETNELAEEAYSKGAMVGPSDLQFPISKEIVEETSAAQNPPPEEVKQPTIITSMNQADLKEVVDVPKKEEVVPKKEEIVPKKDEVILTSTKTMSQSQLTTNQTSQRKLSKESTSRQLVSMKSEQTLPERAPDRKLGKLYTVAIYDYASTKPEELSFYKGDTLKILKKKPNGWWFGYKIEPDANTRQTGWVPSNFVQEFKAIGEGIVMEDFVAQDEGELGVSAQDHVAILDEDPDNNSLLCEFNGQAGWVIANYIKITAVADDNDAIETMKTDSSSPTSSKESDDKQSRLAETKRSIEELVKTAEIISSEEVQLAVEEARLQEEQRAIEAEYRRETERKRKEEEEKKRIAEEERKRKDEEDKKRKEEEDRKKKEEEERKRIEDERKRKEEEQKRIEEEKERKRIEEERRRKEEEERKKMEEEKRKKEEEERLRLEEERKRAEEADRKKKEIEVELEKWQLEQDELSRLNAQLVTAYPASKPLPTPTPNPNSSANQRRPTRELPTPPTLAPKQVQADGITPPSEWFVQLGWCGNIERNETEAKLRNTPKGTYLLRWSDRAKSYVLSYSKPPSFVHVAKITPKSNGELHVETEENVVVTYKNLVEFINHTKAKGIITNPISL